MPSAEIITIGTEILLGEIIDTNAAALARALRQAGIDLYRKTTVGDNTQRIAQAIQQALERCDIVLTSGGLGPTVDDPTRAAVALALKVEIEFHPELWEQIQERFRRYGRQPTENNRRQAYIPQGARAIENPVGTAPAFLVEAGAQCIISLPGVPSEMEYLLKNAVLPYLCRRYDIHTVIKARTLHTAGVGESMIDEKIGDLEQLSNPTVGLAAHAGQVDVRIVAKAESEVEVDRQIQAIEMELRSRLGTWIYGADAETLENIAVQHLADQGWTLAVVEAGLGGMLIQHLSKTSGVLLGSQALQGPPALQELLSIVESYRSNQQAQVGLGVALYPGPARQEIAIVISTPQGQRVLNRSYGGPPEYASRWAANHGLDTLRTL